MWSNDPPQTLADLALDERRLLEKLDELTPAKHRRQTRDDRTGEEVAEATRLADVRDIKPAVRAVIGLNRLVEAGFVERARMQDGVSRYRVSQLGERALLHARLADLEKKLAKRDGVLAEVSRQSAARGARCEALEAQVRELERPWWRRVLGSE